MTDSSIIIEQPTAQTKKGLENIPTLNGEYFSDLQSKT
jgi:hypothetical protein